MTEENSSDSSEYYDFTPSKQIYTEEDESLDWDEDAEQWIISEKKITYSRYNHATVTVPGEMFPQCQ